MAKFSNKHENFLSIGDFKIWHKKTEIIVLEMSKKGEAEKFHVFYQLAVDNNIRSEDIHL